MPTTGFAVTRQNTRKQNEGDNKTINKRADKRRRVFTLLRRAQEKQPNARTQKLKPTKQRTVRAGECVYLQPPPPRARPRKDFYLHKGPV